MTEGPSASSTPAPLIVLVDCDPEMRRALRELLEGDSVRVQEFAGGHALKDACASQALARMRPDLLLCRLELRESCGMQVLELLARATSDITTIIYSTRGDIPSAVGCLRAGAVDFIDHARPDATFRYRVMAALRQRSPRRARAASPPPGAGSSAFFASRLAAPAFKGADPLS